MGKAVFERISRRGPLGVALIAPLLAAACDTGASGSRDDLGPVFEAVYTVAMPAGIAQELADGCSDLAYDKARYESALDAAVQALRDQGFSDERIKADVAQVDQAALSRRARADEAAYVEENGIVFAEPETVCRAGKAEIAEGSAIGAFLSES